MSVASFMSHALSPAFSAVLAFVVFYVGWSIHSYLRLRHIPGPKWWALTRLPLIRIHLDGTCYDRFGELIRSYGPLVRIGPNYLLTSNPDIVRRMNATQSPYIKSNWYISTRFVAGVDNMVSDRDDKRHAIMRRKAAPAYGGKETPSMEKDIDECVLDLVRLIQDRYLKSQDGKPVKMELARKAQYFTTDTISSLSFKDKFNNLNDDTDHHGYIEEVESLFPNLFCTAVIPELMEFLTACGILGLFDIRNSNLALGKVMRIANRQINDRFDTRGNAKDSHADMLGSLIRHGMTQQELEQELIVQLVAGSDTSATAIRATMLCLMQNDKARQRLVDEIDEAIRQGKISDDPEAVISDAQARQMPYLQAIIKEGLRWLPPTGGLLGKQVPAGGDTVDGYFVPGGTILGFSQYAVHHSPTLFAPDPLAFRPERWLHTSQNGDEPSMDKIREMEHNNDLIFGYGKYQCLGKSIAFVELNKVFVELLRRFQFELVDNEKPWTTICYGIHLQRGLWVTVKERERMKN